MTSRTISLVLGGGGARGLAHIGVIQWMEQHGFEIASIAGSSIGALIGGVFAAGKLPVYTHWVTALESRLFRSGVPLHGHHAEHHRAV